MEQADVIVCALPSAVPLVAAAIFALLNWKKLLFLLDLESSHSLIQRGTTQGAAATTTTSGSSSSFFRRMRCLRLSPRVAFIFGAAFTLCTVAAAGIVLYCGSSAEVQNKASSTSWQQSFVRYMSTFMFTSSSAEQSEGGSGFSFSSLGMCYSLFFVSLVLSSFLAAAMCRGGGGSRESTQGPKRQVSRPNRDESENSSCCNVILLNALSLLISVLLSFLLSSGTSQSSRSSAEIEFRSIASNIMCVAAVCSTATLLPFLRLFIDAELRDVVRDEAPQFLEIVDKLFPESRAQKARRLKKQNADMIWNQIHRPMC